MTNYRIPKVALATCLLSLGGIFTYAALPEETKLVKINKKRIPQSVFMTRSCMAFPKAFPKGKDIDIDHAKELAKDPDNGITIVTDEDLNSEDLNRFHGYSEIDFSVNDVVIEYRKKNPKGHDYPAGSMFVKTKYNRGEKAPYSRTLMVKKKKAEWSVSGKASVNDWEFTSESLPDGKVEKLSESSKKNCMACHDNFEDHGYVSKRSEQLLLEFLKITPPKSGPIEGGKPKPE